MPGLVKCDICQKTFNARYVASHKRMAHGEAKGKVSERKQQETMHKILALFEKLPPDTRRRLLEQMKSLAE